MKVQSISADDRNMAEIDVVGYVRRVEYLFTGPFIAAARTRARSAKVGGFVRRFAVVRPFDRQL